MALTKWFILGGTDMYHPYLAIFIKVADCGSFTKAAEQLFISPVAVMKKINRFEDQLGVSLFIRSNRGLTLTPEGELIYAEGNKIIRQSLEVLQKAKQIHAEKKEILHVGTSFLHPCREFTKRWQKVKQKFPNVAIEIVPLSGEAEVYTIPFKKLWQKVDLVYGNLTDANFPGILVQKIGERDLQIGVPQDHKLSTKEKLTIEDLFGYSVVVVQQGYSTYIDQVRAALEVYPQIHLIDTKPYNYAIINQCMNNNQLLLMVDIWQNLHPSLKILPVNWQYKVPYGVIYSSSISQKLKDCIHKITEF